MPERLNLSVLFTEDDPVAMERLASLLEREVLQVSRCPDGQAGLEAFKETRPDLVITDIRMPKMSGIEMAREIRKLDPDVPIIMTSAYNETDYFVDAIEIGIDHYVLKPVEGDLLMRAVRKCGERKFLADARKQAEEALRHANETLEQRVRQRTSELEQALRAVTAGQKEWQDTFDSMSDQIAIIGRDNRIVRSNRAFRELTGKNAADSACYDLFCDPSLVQGSRCPHTRTLADGRMYVEELRRRQDNRLYRVSTFPYRSPAGDLIGSIHVSRDITDVKERELGMIMNERLAMLGQMVAGLAHELKNPLATLMGCSEALTEKVKAREFDRDKISTLVRIVSSEVSRSLKIVDAVMEPLRQRALEPGRVGLAPLLDRTVELIGYQGRLRNVQVERGHAEDTPPVFASEGELQQVFLILISNALDAMSERGKLVIETRSGADTAIAEIADSGPGIPDEYVPRIFDAFFTTKTDAGGTGLGLSIASRIVSGLGGSLSLAATGPDGTRFRITLPAAEAHQQAGAEAGVRSAEGVLQAGSASEEPDQERGTA